MQRRKDKVKDRPPPDPHREYLDAPSSDEEERHRKESVESEVEILPVYEEEELSELIECVKNMTTLSGLTEDHWTFDSELNIRQFILHPSSTVLSIYFLRQRLTVSLGFPIIPIKELTYFIREPQEVLRGDTFQDRILFGTVNDKTESYILRMVQNVLMPLFRKVESWPDSILS
ncbi:dynein axonemal heavy chain 2 [Calliopsis andreniformis]|uniref:dynein axonemal heavy chain 2 n=1 Tax=Calliopsis andreniformis TaxID=337506 RepID=UPI003FCEAE7A